MKLTRSRDGYCRTHLSTFGPTCTRCDSEAARLESIREQVLTGDLSVADSVELVPEWGPLADLVRDITHADTDDDADCL